MRKYQFIEDQEIDVGPMDGPFRSYRLDTHGWTLDECMDNADIAEVDQDGGETGCYALDDAPNEVQTKVEKMLKKLFDAA